MEAQFIILFLMKSMSLELTRAFAVHPAFFILLFLIGSADSETVLHKYLAGCYHF